MISKLRVYQEALLKIFHGTCGPDGAQLMTPALMSGIAGNALGIPAYDEADEGRAHFETIHRLHDELKTPQVETEAPLPLKYHVSEEGWMVCDECGDEAIEVIKCVGCARTTIGRLPARTAPPETTLHHWLPNAAGSFTCDYCGSVATLDPSAPCVGRDAEKASEPQCICATTAEPLRLVDPQCPKHSTRG
jgi:hypothetical protein